MPKGYHHLAYEQRCQIYTLKKRGDTPSQIAKTLNVHKATIHRELQRNRGGKGYRFIQAHKKSGVRRQKAVQQRRKMTPELTLIIESKLLLQWSPEQIAGWLKRCYGGCVVSYETIYQHIWKNKRQKGTLFKHLRHHGKKYNKRGKGKSGRGCIPNRVDIDQRPKIVEEKCRLGDWEGDTIIGKGQKGVLVSVVERRSKLTKLGKSPNKRAQYISNVLITKLGPIKDCVLTVTTDNGKEFANHQVVSQILEAEFFFATPYHSWERGLNEHTNGLIRQYFPKTMDLSKITDEDLERVENLLNNRPRKVLDYLTPMESFTALRLANSSVALQT